MQLDEVATILRENHVDATHYALGGVRPGALCILEEAGSWSVFRTEGSTRCEERSFSTQNEACTYFLLRIFQKTVRNSDGAGGEREE